MPFSCMYILRAPFSPMPESEGGVQLLGPDARGTLLLSPPCSCVAGVQTEPCLRPTGPLSAFLKFCRFLLLQIGISRAACAEDELMLGSVAASAPARILPIVDCRPRSSATANFAAGPILGLLETLI